MNIPAKWLIGGDIAHVTQVSMVIRFLSEPHDIVVSPHPGYCSHQGELYRISELFLTPESKIQVQYGERTMDNY